MGQAGVEGERGSSLPVRALSDAMADVFVALFLRFGGMLLRLDLRQAMPSARYENAASTAGVVKT